MKFFAPTIILVLAGQALAAIDAYLTINDQKDTQGTAGASIITDGVSSNLFKVNKAIQLQSWSYSVEQTLMISSQASGAGAGKIQFNSFNFKKAVDGNSPTFFNYAAIGKPVVSTLYLFKPAAATPFMTIQFRTAAFRTQNISSSGDMLEEINMDYGALQVSYTAANASGTQANVQGWSKINNRAEVLTVAKPN